MSLLKRVILLTLLFFPQICLSNPALSDTSSPESSSLNMVSPDAVEIESVPVGKWRSINIIKNTQTLSGLAVSLFSYKNKIVLLEFTENVQRCFSVDNQSDYLYVDIGLSCEQPEFDIDKLYLHKNQLELVSGDTHYFFVKEVMPSVSSKELSGVWESTSENTNEVYAINIYPDSSVVFTAKAEGESQVARLFMSEGNLPYIAMDDVFMPVFYQPLQLEVIADERRLFKRTPNKLPSQFLVDENGLPVDIDSVAVTAKVNGDLAETTIDIQFKTLNSNNSEVAFRLPLPASASVMGYSLNVGKAMVPAVVVNKEQARNVLETLESRGVDPAIAEFTQNNQFQTEIYPVSKDNPRRIQIQYQEVLEEVKGKYRYSLPLDALGEFKQFLFEIELDGGRELSVLPGSAIRQQLGRYKTSKGKTIGRFKADKFSAQSELALGFTPEKKLALQVQEGKDQGIYFRLPLTIETIAFEPSNILVLWDNSLSMRAYHMQYVAWLNAVRRQFPKANIKVQLFSINDHRPVDMTHSADALESFTSSIVYDGASDLNSIKEVINQQRSETILLFSDAVHSVGLLDLSAASTPIYTVYPDQKISNMPLLEALSTQGNMTSVDNLAAVNQSFFSVLPRVETSAEADNIILRRRFAATLPITILGRLNKADLPYQFAVKVNGAAREFLIDDRAFLAGNSLQYLWATSKIQPLLVNPKQHKQAIIDTGIKYSMVTPYTSLLVLEDMEDYVEFGVKPPPAVDPHNHYEQQRSDYLVEQAEEKDMQKGKLLDTWKARVKWYEDPVGFNKRFLKKRKADISFNFSRTLNSTSLHRVEEVIVTGTRASVSADEMEEVGIGNPGTLRSGIKVAAWQPDTPYMQAIRAVPLDAAYDIYLQQREDYVANPSFYMDVAKYFFDNQQPERGYRVLSNISELMPEKMLAQRLVAYTLMEYQQWELARFYLNFIDEIVPHEATSKRDLAVLLERMASAQAPELILQSAHLYWQAIQLDDSFKHDLAIITLGELNNLIKKWQISPEQIPGFDPRFLQAMEFDLRIVITWANNQADIDLHIQEPDKTKVSYANPYSRSGAWLPFDNTSGFGPEEYLLKSAGKGGYKVAANFYSNNTVEVFGPVSAYVDIYRNYGRTNQQHKTTTFRLDNTKEVVDLAEILLE